MNRFFTTLAASLGLVVFLSACNKVEFAQLPQSTSLGAPSYEVEQVNRACQSKSVRTKQVQVSFPKPEKTCEFGVNGNLGYAAEAFMARTEQVVGFDLPKGSILCDMDFEFPTQRFVYDDFFLLTFNGAVLASSYDFKSMFRAKNGLMLYDWGQMKGRSWSNGGQATYCAGDQQGLADCAWPRTEQLGSIRMDISPRVFQSVTALDVKRTSHEFRFITTGDDNPDIDCLHEPVDFALTVSYVE